MRTILLVGLALGLSPLGKPGAAFAAQSVYLQGSQWGQAAPRVWLEGEPSYFRRGDRLNVRFSVPRDSYVAVVHVDSDGLIEFLYPNDPWDDHFVRGGRVTSVAGRDSFASTTIWSGAGIGYLYLISSPTPLDFGYFRAGIRSAWDWGYAGQSVHGDPFLAFDQVTRMLLPGWPYARFDSNYHGYYVEGIHRYPSFACSDRGYEWGWGWSPTYSSCNRHDVFVRTNPNYYDTRRYVGDRRVYYRQYESLDPRYGFKEPPRGSARGRTAVQVPAPSVGGGRAEPDDIPRRDPVGVGVVPRAAEPQTGSGNSRGPAVPTRDAVPQRAPQQPQATPGRAASPAPSDRTPERAPAAPAREPAPRAAPEPPPQSSGSGATGRAAEPQDTDRTRPVPAIGRRDAPN